MKENSIISTYHYYILHCFVLRDKSPIRKLQRNVIAFISQDLNAGKRQRDQSQLDAALPCAPENEN